MSVDWERWAYVVALLCYTLLTSADRAAILINNSFE